MDGLYQPHEASRGSYSYDTLANHVAKQSGSERQ